MTLEKDKFFFYLIDIRMIYFGEKSNLLKDNLKNWGSQPKGVKVNRTIEYGDREQDFSWKKGPWTNEIMRHPESNFCVTIKT